jgi:hypothetical protein
LSRVGRAEPDDDAEGASSQHRFSALPFALDRGKQPLHHRVFHERAAVGVDLDLAALVCSENAGQGGEGGAALPQTFTADREKCDFE